MHFTLVRHSRAATIERLRKNLRVMEKVKQSDVIVATLRNPDPDVASRVLNEIGRQYLAQNVEQRSLEAARSLAFLELQEPLLKARLTESEARLTALRNEQGSIDLVEEAKLALAHSANASTHLVELRQRREALLARYTPSHPDVLATERQIALFEQERALADNKVRGLPDLQQQVLRRMLDVKVNTDLYTALLNNMQQLQLIRAGRIGNVRVVDSATPPEEPVGPRNTLIVIASLVFGVVFGSGYVMVRSMLSRRIVDPREIERHLGMRVLIGIPFDPVTRDRPRPRAESAAIGPSPETDDTPAIEQLRTLRILLDHARRDAANDIVVITSASASAGTSFVAGELARVYGAAGSRVLLIDGDTREGRLSRKYGQAHAPGLMEILAAGRAPDEIAIRDITPGVDFLAAGTTQGYAADRLTSPPVWDGIGTYATRYDAVFVATCPVLSGPDAAAFARVAGTTLLVVRAARTTLEQAGEALDRLTASGARVDGIVVNGVGPRAASRRARRQP
ncbi:GNVR domain-containing protein [Burkholderia sp. AU33803]|uniref:GNVR domain-containing protein n=1 Tax=Burkholderia sp. AU33803 TaxID=2015357 RepID=UPI00211B1E1F|nr:GNVR domain-containing protein [Burkholderia sp. AU33803]